MYETTVGIFQEVVSEWLEICSYKDFGQCRFTKRIILVLGKRGCVHCIFDRVEGVLFLFNRLLVISLSALFPLFFFLLFSFSLCKEEKESISV